MFCVSFCCVSKVGVGVASDRSECIVFLFVLDVIILKKIYLFFMRKKGIYRFIPIGSKNLWMISDYQLV